MPNKIVEHLLQTVAELHSRVDKMGVDIGWIKRGLWTAIALFIALCSGGIPFVLGHITWH